MATFEQDIAFLKTLKDVILPSYKKAVNDNSNELEQDQRDQLKKGEDRDGNQIKPDYSEGYAFKKRKFGLNANFVDWKFTGRLYKGLIFKATNAGIEITSNVPYIAPLIKKYNDGRVLGLQSEVYYDFVKNEIIPTLKTEINGKFNERPGS